MIRRLILLAVALMLTCVSAVAAPNDIKCSGVLVAEDGEPIIGATISVPGTKIVATTDVDGRFTLTVPKGKEIHVNYIGYKPLNLIASSNLGEIRMEVESQMLSDVVVTQSIARTRRTPVAVSAVDAATLDIKLGNQELLKSSRPLPAYGRQRTAAVSAMPRSTSVASSRQTPPQWSTVSPSTIWNGAVSTGLTGQVSAT